MLKTKILYLHVRKKYFDSIKIGEKKYEYRLYNDYWRKKLSKEYQYIMISCGYPKKNESEKKLLFKYNGFHIEKIIHNEFNNIEQEVFAIYLNEKA